MIVYPWCHHQYTIGQSHLVMDQDCLIRLTTVEIRYSGHGCIGIWLYGTLGSDGQTTMKYRHLYWISHTSDEHIRLQTIRGSVLEKGVMLSINEMKLQKILPKRTTPVA